MRILSVLIISISVLGFSNAIQAQEFYAKGSFGYGLKWGSQNLPGFYNRIDGKVTDREQIYVSFGKGINAEGTVGYLFNAHVGGEFSVNYLIGSKYSARRESESGSNEKTMNANMMRLNPSIIISADPENTIIPFARLGLVVGMGSINIVESEYDFDDGDIEIYKSKLKGGLALGIKAGVGASYVISDQLSIFGELSMIGMSFGPKKGEILEATKNGDDILSELTTRQIETEYVNDYTEKEDDEGSDDLPRVRLREKLPFGSVGLNVGVRYSISY